MSDHFPNQNCSSSSSRGPGTSGAFSELPGLEGGEKAKKQRARTGTVVLPVCLEPVLRERFSRPRSESPVQSRPGLSYAESVCQGSGPCSVGCLVSLRVSPTYAEPRDSPAGGRKPDWRAGMARRRIERKDRVVSCKLRGENPRKRGSCSGQTSDRPDLCPRTQGGCEGDPCTSGSDLY